MRISDWSSDVCSSDLLDPGRPADTRNGNDVDAGGTPRLCHAVVPVRDHSAGDLCAGAEEPMAETADFVSRQGTASGRMPMTMRASRTMPTAIGKAERDRPCRVCPGPSAAALASAMRRMSSSSIASREAPLLSRMYRAARSEEHTSELQSLMRISYAVFCLKTTNNQTSTYQIQRTQ